MKELYIPLIDTLPEKLGLIERYGDAALADTVEFTPITPAMVEAYPDLPETHAAYGEHEAA